MLLKVLLKECATQLLLVMAMEGALGCTSQKGERHTPSHYTLLSESCGEQLHKSPFVQAEEVGPELSTKFLTPPSVTGMQD